MQLLKRKRSDHPFTLSPIKAIEIAAARIPGSISLAQGIPSFQTPDVIKEYVHEKIEQGVCDKYSLTIGLPELREEIALSLSEDGFGYDPEAEILATVGSIEGITASLIACTDPGDEVILPSPSYASYAGGIAMAGCTPKYVSLAEEENFDFDVERIAAAITSRTRVILYCSPNNPTGTLFSEEKTRALVELAEKHDLLILVDEVYKDFYYSEEAHFSPASIPEARERLIRACSFSKAYAMTGWRIGFLLAPAPIMQGIVKYHDAMVTCAPVVSQYAGIAALRFGAPYRTAFVEEFRKRRDQAICALDELSRYVDYQLPKATYFVFPRMKDSVPLAHDSERLAYDILEKTNVALVPGKAFGPSGENHLRINFGRSESDLREGLARLGDYLTKKPRTSSEASSPLPAELPQRPAEQSLLRKAALSTVRFAARTYLRRKNPQIIGIAGNKGKTVYKRLFQDFFSTTRKTRSSILSYNTELGMCLSILNLAAPKSTKERAFFPLRVLYRLFLDSEQLDLLILEYGITYPEDSEQLLSVAKPDWLILTPITSTDSSINQRGVDQGLTRLVTHTKQDHVIYPKHDPRAEEVTQRRGCPVVASPYKSAGGRELIGESAKLAAASLEHVARELGVSSEQIESYFETIIQRESSERTA